MDHEDRLSMLTDDILLSILGRVDIISAVRTSVVSTRWKHLPWLLPEFTIDVKDFLPVPQPNRIKVEHMDEAMASLTKGIRSLLTIARSEFPINRFQLKLYLINNYSRVVGPMLDKAIEVGILKDMDLSVLDEEEIVDCTDKHILQQASSVKDLFSGYPSVLTRLTRLSLYNLCFARWDLHHHLFECCNQLRYLSLSNCDVGKNAIWKISAPNSNIIVLELDVCCLEKLEVLCLPKLERLNWDTWLCPYAPLSFDVVPNLQEVSLICGATNKHEGFILSEVPSGTTNIHTLTLDFQGEKLWIKPEGKQLFRAFSNLRKLSIHSIFSEFELLWTTNLLEAAPSLEMFDIEIWEHTCDVDREPKVFGERPNPAWKAPDVTSFRNSLLKELQIVAFRPLKQQLEFIRVVMQQAPNLGTIILKYDDPCEYCEALGIFPPRSSTECVFPKSKDEQDRVINLLKDGVCSPAQIVFRKPTMTICSPC
nr:uncharacterized protein LOC107276641 isoform X1 [Oryza sativa Japonica Group]